MDIVISYYEESLERRNLYIDLFRRDERVARQKTWLFIYSKSRKYTLEYIQNTTQADVVVRLPNHGREGHSYFTHIVKYYDSDLADHTLFMQADPEFWVTGRKGNESMHEHTFNRLKYLSDKTGYMPFAQSFGRNFGGGEGGDFPHLRDIFVLARGYFPSRNRIQTSWKGQFIVSRGSIHKTRRSVYQYLVDMLDEPEGHPIHNEPDHDFRHGMKSIPSDPIFGHTIERSYGILFDCWKTEMDRLCRTAEAPGCQCFDE